MNLNSRSKQLFNMQDGVKLVVYYRKRIHSINQWAGICASQSIRYWWTAWIGHYLCGGI